jgi:glycerophosphoryl diester phosphodiesterase
MLGTSLHFNLRNSNRKIMQLPKIIAHRGASLFAPENTLAAVDAAYRMGAQWLECDVQLTKDHHPVIFHDFNLKRVTGRNAKVADLTLAEIKELDAGRWFSPVYAGEKIPTLSEWLQLTAHFGLGVNLEIKIEQDRFLPKMVDQVTSALKVHWRGDLPAPIISSFSQSCLEGFYKQDKNLQLGWLVKRWNNKVLAVLEEYQSFSLHAAYNCLSAERVQAVRATGKKVLAYTIDDLHLANYYWDLGVDAVFSNNLYAFSAGAAERL